MTLLSTLISHIIGLQPWKSIPEEGLLGLLNLFTAVPLIFEGYNQGVMGSVSGTRGFIDVAQLGANATNSTK